MKFCAKRIGVLLLLTVVLGTIGRAQDDAQFTLFPWATSYYNAGGIGEQSNTLCFTAIYDNKYLGWKDLQGVNTNNLKDSADKTAPQDFMLNIESYLKKLHGSLGATFIRDQVGFYKNIGVKLGYSYKLRVAGGHMGIGLQVGMFNQAVSSEGFRPIQTGDPVLSQLDESTLDLDFNFGLFYKTDQWYVGASLTQIAGALDKNQALRVSGNKGSQRSSNFYLHGGYTWIVPSNPNWEIIPHTMIKLNYASVPVIDDNGNFIAGKNHIRASSCQWDLMLTARYNGVMWGGLGYRLNDAVNLVFGARPFYNSSNIYLKGLEAGVSYGITANSLGYRANRSFGDVEVMVRYCFDIYKPEVFSGYGSTRSIYKNQY